MLTLEQNRLVIRFPEVHMQAKCRILFRCRTIQLLEMPSSIPEQL
jgi:hypothetical protein